MVKSLYAQYHLALFVTVFKSTINSWDKTYPETFPLSLVNLWSSVKCKSDTLELFLELMDTLFLGLLRRRWSKPSKKEKKTFKQLWWIWVSSIHPITQWNHSGTFLFSHRGGCTMLLKSYLGALSRTPAKDYQKAWYSELSFISTDDSQSLFPEPKAQRSYPLIYWGKSQRTGSKLGGCK